MNDANDWSPLGTDGGHIEIVEYHSEWPIIFELEKVAILERCHPWVTEVHHVGSTSVPGLAAKPLLDIMPVVANPDDGEDAVEPMATLGYRYRDENGLPGTLLLRQDRRRAHGRTRPYVPSKSLRCAEVNGLPGPPQIAS